MLELNGEYGVICHCLLTQKERNISEIMEILLIITII